MFCGLVVSCVLVLVRFVLSLVRVFVLNLGWKSFLFRSDIVLVGMVIVLGGDFDFLGLYVKVVVVRRVK